MPDIEPQRAHRPVGDCPYCRAVVHADEPRGLDHRGALAHLPCLDDEQDGPCSICGEGLHRRQARGTDDTNAHLTCESAKKPAPPQPPRPLILDALLVAMTEVGIARGRLRGSGDTAVAVRASPDTIRELNRLAGASYSQSFAVVVGLPTLPDASLPEGRIEVDGTTAAE